MRTPAGLSRPARDRPLLSRLARDIYLERESSLLATNLLVRIHFIIEMILVDRPCAMGV